MHQLLYSFLILLLGIGLVTIIDVSGSIISRRLNFNYGYFTILSFVAYVSVSYLVVSGTHKALLTMIVVMLVGLYDATVGFAIAQKLKANYNVSKEAMEKMTLTNRVSGVNIFAILCGIVGYYLGR
jgi:hypothetical protein